MERSPSLERDLEQLYAAVSSGDGEAVAAMTTARDGLVFIGTDPDEWFDDVDDVRRMMKSQAGAGITVEHGTPVAFEEGTVGWVADRGNFVLPDGTKMPFRLTAVFHRESGAWKLVQEHASVAQTNAETLGVDL
jgi:ketosteroid isomerase-like protein